MGVQAETVEAHLLCPADEGRREVRLPCCSRVDWAPGAGWAPDPRFVFRREPLCGVDGGVRVGTQGSRYRRSLLEWGPVVPMGTWTLR